MKYIQFSDTETFDAAILIKEAAFNKQAIQESYVAPLNALGITELIAFTLDYGGVKKPSIKTIKAYLAELLPVLQSLKVTYLYVTDGEYFKVLTKSRKAEPHHGYVLTCAIKDHENLKIVLGINYQAMIYIPELQIKLTNSLQAVSSGLLGTYSEPGSNIIQGAYYPVDYYDIKAAIQQLHQYPELTADIEGFSLQFDKADIGTIAFAWDKHNGVAFACAASSFDSHRDLQHPTVRHRGGAVKALLKEFFSTYKGKLIWHNSTYDLKSIIYTLWMEDINDTKGLLTGLEIMTRSFDDTKIIAYLATNSTSGNVLGLKPLAQEFAGNWAQDDIKDITRIRLEELLQYNLVDALSTWYVRDKYLPIMKTDSQEELYETLMKPSLKTIIQIEMTGMPLNRHKVAQVKQELEETQINSWTLIQTDPIIKTLALLLQFNKMEATNAKLKKKQHPLEKFKDVSFNPNSGPQLQRLLYEQMGLPIIDLTETKQPATGADTIKKLINHTQEAGYKRLLTALIDYAGVTKILDTFIPAFEKAIENSKGSIAWLRGNFNLGGTVSGRLSSSEPNLQNLPAKSKYGKLIKSCFMADTGWLFVGADFNSLEDYISALTTRDPNKLKVYLDGFDGHCLRAYSYFRDSLPEVRQADTTDRCFKIKVNDSVLLCKSGDSIVLPDGKTITIEDYFDSYSRA